MYFRYRRKSLGTRWKRWIVLVPAEAAYQHRVREIAIAGKRLPLTDDFLNLRPRLSAVVFIPCRQDALVLLRLAQEVFGALLRSLAG